MHDGDTHKISLRFANTRQKVLVEYCAYLIRQNYKPVNKYRNNNILNISKEFIVYVGFSDTLFLLILFLKKLPLEIIYNNISKADSSPQTAL